MMSKCKHCGHTVAGDFCTECGTPAVPKASAKARRWSGAVLLLLLVGVVGFALWPLHARDPGQFLMYLGGTFVVGLGINLVTDRQASRLRAEWGQLARELDLREVLHEGKFALEGQHEGYQVRVFCGQSGQDPPVPFTRIEHDCQTTCSHEFELHGKVATLGMGFLNVKLGDAYFDGNYGFRGDLDPAVVERIMSPEVRVKIDGARTSRAFTGQGIPSLWARGNSIAYEAPGYVVQKDKLRAHLDAFVALSRACEQELG